MKLKVSAVACALLLAAPTADAIPVQPADAVVSRSTGTVNFEFEAPNPHNDVPGPSNVGVELDVRRVAGIDLSTNEGWQAASELDIDELMENATFDQHFSGVTDANGDVRFTQVPIGLYLVTPVERGDFVPFALTLPMADVPGTDWLYEITTYPKVEAAAGDGSVSDKEPDSDPDPALRPSPGPSPQPSPGPGGEDDATGTEAGEVPSQEPESGQDDQSRSGLASTGASVVGISVLGLALMLLGYFLSRRRSPQGQP